MYTSGEKTVEIYQYANINVGNVPLHFFFCETVFFLWKSNM